MKGIVNLVGLLGVLALTVWSCGKTEAATAEIRIETALCEMCGKTIQTAAAEVAGVTEASVDLEKKIVLVKYDGSRTNLATIEDAVVMAGYMANDKPADSMAYAARPACCKVEQTEQEEQPEPEAIPE
ncbi:MAG: hypothetical protein GH158_06790 [Dehalococcoidia bacterium]|nr:hypothetical protein [Dehalococcoidia bacterium]